MKLFKFRARKRRFPSLEMRVTGVTHKVGAGANSNLDLRCESSQRNYTQVVSLNPNIRVGSKVLVHHADGNPYVTLPRAKRPESASWTARLRRHMQGRWWRIPMAAFTGAVTSQVYVGHELAGSAVLFLIFLLGLAPQVRRNREDIEWNLGPLQTYIERRLINELRKREDQEIIQMMFGRSPLSEAFESIQEDGSRHGAAKEYLE